MGASGPGKGIVRLVTTTGSLVFGWTAATVAWGPRYHEALDAKRWLEGAIYRVFAGFPSIVVTLERALPDAFAAAKVSTMAALVAATMAIPMGFVSRLVVRARVRAGHPDPLDRLRRWTSSRPGATRAVLAVPALAWAFFVERAIVWGFLDWGQWRRHESFLANAIIAAACGLAEWALLRRGLDVLLAPTFDEPQRARDVAEDELTFDAVAVTRETVGAVALMALLPIAFVAWTASAQLTRLYTDRHVFQLMGAYFFVALSGAYLFKRGSRIAIGVDGIRVYGTSRARFFPHTKLDAVRVRRGDIELVRDGKTLVRLQLHGEDAARREAIVQHVASRIETSRDLAVAGALRLVEGSTTDEVARATSGGAGYRAAAVTRDDLWRLVEGTTTDTAARSAAAEVLARTRAPKEGARLRVAAQRCADIRVRVALETSAREMDREEEGGAAVRSATS